MRNLGPVNNCRKCRKIFKTEPNKREALCFRCSLFGARLLQRFNAIIDTPDMSAFKSEMEHWYLNEPS